MATNTQDKLMRLHERAVEAAFKYAAAPLSTQTKLRLHAAWQAAEEKFTQALSKAFEIKP